MEGEKIQNLSLSLFATQKSSPSSEEAFDLVSIFNFTLRTIVYNFVIFFVNQIFNKYEFIPLIFKAFKNIWQSRRCMVGIVVEKYNTAVFNL